MKSDSQLKQDVTAELHWEPAVNASQIGVEVKDGIVTLAGHVDSYTEKWNAERAAQRVAGVTGLAIAMEVLLPGTSQRDDADIARSAEDLLTWSSFLPKDSIKVMVEKGWVTLTGQVRWDFERRDVTSSIRKLMGVTGVSDQITIKPGVSATVVKSDIEAALKRRAQSDAELITVDVKGSEVFLSGTAHTWAERDMASHAAWSAPGVQSVVDNIVVTY
ncbi:BON domain-containing protein [Acidovorax sp. A1169]|uniref:BON domain-containing protein n=1 Tax=Acidovorax sp. A1169 TaxID=3059524 RepID=UPI002737920B|nr:BON domain-containing protein [Acidovorax sp. A1169]MDP4076389.1 BON domain-containing protein [Acidovorax sp. A1169]